MSSDLDELEEKIRSARGEKPLSDAEARKKRDRANYHMAAKAGFEFALSAFFGAGLGYFIDSYFETTPLFLILFFFLGVSAGFLSLFRMSKNMGASVGYMELHKNVEKDADNGLHPDKKEAKNSPTLKK